MNEPRYEEQFVVVFDFLGFSEASAEIDEKTRQEILQLLVSLATLQSEFHAAVEDLPNGGRQHRIKPAISTFSDHAVMSWPLQSIRQSMTSEHSTAMTVVHQAQRLLTVVAAAALRTGFLLRGAATIGRLFHANGAIFGEALIEAFNLEARTAFYPRVILAREITKRQDWLDQTLWIARDEDGLYRLDHIRFMILSSAPPGDEHHAGVRAWFEAVVHTIQQNLIELELSGRLNELAKWTWFAKKFRASISATPELLAAFGITLDAIPWT